MRGADMKIYEADLHKAVADLLDVALMPPAVWTTFPAGWGQLGKAVAGRLKAAGLKPGFPDILIFCNGTCVGIELKAPEGTLSMEQTDMFRRLASAGVKIHVCRSQTDVLNALRRENLPVRNLGYAA